MHFQSNIIMSFSQKAFNKTVRSHEAITIGFLIGTIFGIALMIFIPITLHETELKSISKLCNDYENVKIIDLEYTGNIKKIVCKDGRVFDNF